MSCCYKNCNNYSRSKQIKLFSPTRVKHVWISEDRLASTTTLSIKKEVLPGESKNTIAERLDRLFKLYFIEDNTSKKEKLRRLKDMFRLS